MTTESRPEKNIRVHFVTTNQCVMETKMIAPGQKTVLCIGYGFAGSIFSAQFAANHAEKANATVHVVTATDYLENTTCNTLALATSNNNARLLDINKEPNVTYTVGAVESLTGDKVTVKKPDGSSIEIEFDVAVVAAGMKYPGFKSEVTHDTKEKRLQAMEEWRTKANNAKKIVVCGGGAVGVEYACDAKLRSPDKEVIIVHSKSNLLNTMDPTLSEFATKRCREKVGLKLFLEKKVVSNDSNSVTLDDGSVIEGVDMYVPAMAGKASTEFMPAGTTEANGCISVNEHLQSKTFKNVFAVGDCQSLVSVKTIMKIESQMDVVLANVAATLKGESLKSYTPWFPDMQGPGLVALGHDHPKMMGLGPDLPGCFCKTFCFACCCMGTWPCTPMISKTIAQEKSTFNVNGLSIKPSKGMVR